MQNSPRSVHDQAGFTLIEALICVALMFIVSAGAVAGLAGIGKASATDPRQTAARAALARARAIAQALSKYTGDVTLSGKPWVVEMPNPRGAPVPVTITATRNEDAITFTATFNASRGPMTLSESMYPVRKAPAPSSTTLPGLHPDPASTP